jgi:Zn-dependent M28 family amino/carboxypeptidase
MREKPKRSVLFMAFTAEERGLYGSTSYVQNPLFPLEKTVAMFNLDMIGRNSMDSAYLEGASVSPDLVDIVKNQNKGIGFTLVPDDELFERSDNAPFYKKKVPFISCSSGLHADYHTVRDNPDTINPAKAAKISRLIFKTAWFVANDNKYYQLKELKK